MSQLGSLAKRLRWPLLLLGLVAVLVGVVYWLLLPAGPIGPRAFHRIQLGMTEEEVEEVIGGPAGFYFQNQPPPKDILQYYFPTSAIQKGQPYIKEDEYQTRNWYGNEFMITVTFDLDRRVTGVCLSECIFPPPANFLDRLRAWLGL